MITTKFTFHLIDAVRKWLTITPLLLTCALSPAHADTNTQVPTSTEQISATEAKLLASVENLVNIQKSIELKLEQVRELREKLKKPEDDTEKQELEKRITRIRDDITSLQSSFEHITLGGINRSILNEQPDKPINWQDEIEQISRPLLSTLKELTAKPRQIDSLRRDIERQEAQIKVIDKALESIRFFNSQSLPVKAVEPVSQLLTDWEQRREDIERKLEISQYKLDNVVTESESWQTSTSELISGFIHGRGLTLFLAIIVGLLIWLALKGIINLYWRWLYQTKHDIGITRAPLLYYSYRLASFTIIVLAILTVFYVRGDVLLLTLALIALAGAALALRQTLPRYAAEIRLLLGVGPVRENERMILDGVPFKVDSLSVYSVLRNPLLDGFVRIPLHEMNDHISRPSRKEVWFPCQPEDFVLLPNGNLARVIRQTIELVEVAVVDSIMQIRTRDFIEQNVRNLSREGFGIACTFGVDYQHQAICLDEIPAKFQAAITDYFEKKDLHNAIKDILVEFAAAGASSLDYRIYLVLHGHAAKAYYRAQRLVAQACVDTCNKEGWIIPFTQITVHSGSENTGPEQHIQAALKPSK